LGYGLIGYAENEFALNKRQKDGSTLRENLESAYRQTRVQPVELEPIDIPYGTQYLWTYFCELSNGRGYSETGPSALTFTEILAWSQLTKSDPTAWEVEAIKAIDRAFLMESMKK